MDEGQQKFKGIKGMNKGEKLTQLSSYHSKLQKNGLMQDGVEGVHNIH
jgi:hypothetical protein